MQIRTLITITTISFLMNGCLLDRIQKRLSISQNAKQNNKKVVKDLNQTISNSQKEYKPSKPTEPIYAQPDKIEVVPKNKQIAKKVNIKKTKKVVHKVLPEPYSIKKNESDPELLGPQTTLKSNPLTKKDPLVEKTKSKKKG